MKLYEIESWKDLFAQQRLPQHSPEELNQLASWLQTTAGLARQEL